MELLGVSLAAECSWVAGRTGGRTFGLAAAQILVGVCTYSDRHYGVRWLGSTCSYEIYTQNLMGLIVSTIVHRPLGEFYHLKSDRFQA